MSEVIRSDLEFSFVICDMWIKGNTGIIWNIMLKIVSKIHCKCRKLHDDARVFSPASARSVNVTFQLNTTARSLD